MEYDNIEVCIRNKRYMEVSNLMLRESLRNRIHKLGTRERDMMTKRVARTLKKTHQRLLLMRESGYNPIEIAQEAYEQTREALGLDKFDPIITLDKKHNDIRPRQGTDESDDPNRWVQEKN